MLKRADGGVDVVQATVDGVPESAGRRPRIMAFRDVVEVEVP